MSSTLSLDQNTLRLGLRELTPAEREWFQLVVGATVRALSEKRASTISSNTPEVTDACKQLGRCLGANVEVVYRDNGLVDVVISPRLRRKARP